MSNVTKINKYADRACIKFGASLEFYTDDNWATVIWWRGIAIELQSNKKLSEGGAQWGLDLYDKITSSKSRTEMFELFLAATVSE